MICKYFLPVCNAFSFSLKSLLERKLFWRGSTYHFFPFTEHAFDMSKNSLLSLSSCCDFYFLPMAKMAAAFVERLSLLYWIAFAPVKNPLGICASIPGSVSYGSLVSFKNNLLLHFLYLHYGKFHTYTKAVQWTLNIHPASTIITPPFFTVSFWRIQFSFCFSFIAGPLALWDLSSPTRDQTCALSSESKES